MKGKRGNGLGQKRGRSIEFGLFVFQLDVRHNSEANGIAILLDFFAERGDFAFGSLFARRPRVQLRLLLAFRRVRLRHALLQRPHRCLPLTRFHGFYLDLASLLLQRVQLLFMRLQQLLQLFFQRFASRLRGFHVSLHLRQRRLQSLQLRALRFHGFHVSLALVAHSAEIGLLRLQILVVLNVLLLERFVLRAAARQLLPQLPALPAARPLRGLQLGELRKERGERGLGSIQ